jgi:acyl carrier protein
MEVFAEIRKMIVKLFAIDEQEISTEAHLQDDLGGDSVAVMRLAEAIGTHYGIGIIAEDILDIENVGQLVDLVKSKIS